MKKYPMYENQVLPDKFNTEPSIFKDEEDLLQKLKVAIKTKSTIYAYCYSVNDSIGTAYLEFIEGGNVEGYIEKDDVTYPQGDREEVHVGRAIHCIDKIIPVKILDIETDNDGFVNVKCSRRLAIEEIRDKYNEDILNKKLTSELIVKGIVSGMDHNKVYVDIGGDVTGILGVADIAKAYVKDPADVIKIGDELELCIKNVYSKNEEQPMHVSLSRAMLLDGWTNLDRRIKEGRIVPGIVKNRIREGIFIELNESMEGLANTDNIPASVNLKYGDRVNVKIMKIDKKREKLKLRIILNK